MGEADAMERGPKPTAENPRLSFPEMAGRLPEDGARERVNLPEEGRRFAPGPPGSDDFAGDYESVYEAPDRNGVRHRLFLPFSPGRAGKTR